MDCKDNNHELIYHFFNKKRRKVTVVSCCFCRYHMALVEKEQNLLQDESTKAFFEWKSVPNGSDDSKLIIVPTDRKPKTLVEKLKFWKK